MINYKLIILFSNINVNAFMYHVFVFMLYFRFVLFLSISLVGFKYFTNMIKQK
ncbi:hypothetical protein CNEO4_1120010 [Clostridium neonatale]|nr:hypothetical protein CNEO4_1120010 [Clostridium neonatale]